ncbi:MAG TPA: NUDIX domain-containing protein [Dehalococcoidia bacterium]|nr:NUDIX domain-containing protein [Dehalococcoidia bacterium]
MTAAVRERAQRRLREWRIVLLRRTPLSWRAKRWLIWALSPRYALGVHVTITDAQGRVLALRSAYSRLWQLPGGGVGYGESLERAMRREAREETGLALRDLRLVALQRDTSGRGLHGLFRAEPAPGAIRLSEEHTEWRYLPVAELPPFYRRCAANALAADRGDGVPVFAAFD